MNEVTGAAVPLLPVALLPVLGGVPELLLPEPTTLPLPSELPEPWLTPLLLSVPEPGLATLPLPGELPEPALSPLPGVEVPVPPAFPLLPPGALLEKPQWAASAPTAHPKNGARNLDH
jgi:hypothetical protein